MDATTTSVNPTIPRRCGHCLEPICEHASGWLDGLNAALTEARAEIAKLKMEIESIEGLAPYKLGFMDGRAEAAKAVEALMLRHKKMGHLMTVEMALEAVAVEVNGMISDDSGCESLRAEIAAKDARIAELEKALVFVLRAGAYLTQKGDEIYYDTGPVTGEWKRTVGTDSDLIRVMLDAAKGE